ncbi:hypothetical protein [Roseomonas gilardii]|uniref:hypothetical protein n=1 Tax=Roseomonas gilardii TaxID=257708 RepID=UPI0012EB44BB|nr:hypothetical protein [Roseomonas gilardii]
MTDSKRLRDQDAQVLSAYIKENQDETLGLAPKIKCRDGFGVSIQASRYHYCTPREDGPEFWTEFECGFPTAPVRSWREWRDGPTPDTQNVFGFVPASKIMDVIRRHGGCDALDALRAVAATTHPQETGDGE